MVNMIDRPMLNLTENKLLKIHEGTVKIPVRSRPLPLRTPAPVPVPVEYRPYSGVLNTWWQTHRFFTDRPQQFSLPACNKEVEESSGCILEVEEETKKVQD
jgi:hypothetical protein